MNIGLFTSVYFNNIGNGFIDLGAEMTIREAISTMPEEAKIIKVSQCANFAASMGKTFMLKENCVVNWLWTHIMQNFANRLHDRSYQAVSTLDVFSAASMFHFDYLIIPGCVLTVPFFTIYGKLLEDKIAQGCKLVFLGASGNYYTDYEINFVTQYLEKLNPYAIMTRDAVAFQHYSKCSSNVYNGIDNVFFVNKLEIPKLDSIYSSYDVVNIEEPKHKKTKEILVKELRGKGRKIIYSNHKPFPYTKISKLVKQNDFLISDYPLDYLLLYRNVDTVYSDRVHACIPTLSFGNKAVLYSDSPRKVLFESVGIEKIDGKPMQLEGLAQKQEAQIEFLKEILK